MNRSHWPVSLLSVLASIVGLFLPLVLVRLLTPEEIGQFKLFFLYVTVVYAFSLAPGFQSGLGYWGGRRSVEPRALPTSFAVLCVLALVAAPCSYFVAPYLLGTHPYVALLFALSVSLWIVGRFFDEAAVSVGRIWGGASLYAGFELLRSLALISAALYFKTLEAVLIAHCVVSALKLVVGILSGLNWGTLGGRPSWEELRNVNAYAIPVSIAWMFGLFINYADQIVVAQFVPAAAFALYSLGCLQLPPLFAFEQSVTRVLIPQLSESIAAQQPKRAAFKMRSAIAELLYIMLPAAVGIALFAEPITDLLFTVRYHEAALYMRWFAVSYVLIVLPYDALARAVGDSRWILRNFIVVSIFSLGIVILLAYYFGAVGALAGGLLARLVLNISGIIYTAKRTGWRASEFLPLRELAWLCVITFPLAAACYFVRSAFTDQLLWLLVAGGAFGFLTVLLGWFAVAPRSRESKVLQVVQSLEIGGLERFVVGLCCKLNPHVPVAVYAYAQPMAANSQNDLVEKLQSCGIEVELRSKPSGVSFVEMLRLAKYIRNSSVTIIQTHDLGGLIYASLANLLAGWCARIVHTQHSFIHLQRRRHYRLLEWIFSHAVSRLIAISSEVQAMYKQLGFKAQIVGGGIEIEANALESRADKLLAREEFLQRAPEIAARLLRYRDCKWLVSVARIFPQKGQIELLKLWELLPEQTRVQSILLFIGPVGDERYANELYKQASSAARSERIFFIGPSSQVEEWVRLSDLYLSASASEGLPLAPLEALALGVRAFLSDIAGHSDFAAWGQLFSLSEPEQSAQQLNVLLNQDVCDYSSAAVGALRKAAAEVRSRYALQAVAQQYKDIYDQLGA